MKKRASFLFLIFFLIPQITNSQWEKIIIPTTQVTSSVFTSTLKGDTIFVVDNFKQILRSMDKGISWSILRNGLLPSTWDLSALHIADDTVFAASNNGFYYSSDWGNNWIFNSAGLPQRIKINSINRTGNKIFIASKEHGIYTANFCEDIWQPDTIGLPRIEPFPDIFYSVAATASVDTFIFAGTRGMYKRSTNTKVWIPRNNGFPSDRPEIYRLKNFYNNLYVSISNECNSVVYSSTDLGENWVNQSGNLMENTGGCRQPVTSILVTDSVWYAGTQYGIYRSFGNSKHWEKFDQGISEENPWVDALHVSNGEIYAATSVGLYRLKKGENVWVPLLYKIDNPVYFSALGSSGNNLIGEAYTYSWNGSPRNLFLSTDNGQTWSKHSGINGYINYYNHIRYNLFFGYFILFFK